MLIWGMCLTNNGSLNKPCEQHWFTIAYFQNENKQWINSPIIGLKLINDKIMTNIWFDCKDVNLFIERTEHSCRRIMILSAFINNLTVIELKTIFQVVQSSSDETSKQHVSFTLMTWNIFTSCSALLSKYVQFNFRCEISEIELLSTWATYGGKCSSSA